MAKKVFLSVIGVAMLCLIGCSQEIKPFNDHVVAMWAQTLEPYSVDIAFLGDSRVAGANWKEAFPNSDVVNLGIGGDIVEGNIQRLPLLEALDVKHCFLAIGANNCNSKNFSAKLFRANYDALLDGLEERGITVYVNTIAGVTTANSSVDAVLISRMNTNMAVANDIIRNVSEARGLKLFDMAIVMNNPDGTLKAEYSADGVHFSAAGNQIWYDTLRPSVEAAF